MDKNLTELNLNIKITTESMEESETDALVLTVYDDLVLEGQAKTVNLKLKEKMTCLMESGDFKGKCGEIGLIYSEGLITSKRILLLGLGNRSKFDEKVIRDVAAAVVNKLNGLKVKSAVVALYSCNKGEEFQQAKDFTEASLMTAYQYKGQKTDFDKENTLNELSLSPEDGCDLDRISAGIKAGVAYAEGVYFTRDLVSLPPNICTPSFMSKVAEEMANENGLNVNILQLEELKKEKMGAFLAVARGSVQKPEMIVLEHNRDKAAQMKTIVLVGKGVTFDAGGYSLKSVTGIVGMKGDMGGAGAVLGAMKTIAKLNLPYHVVGITPCAENKISGNSYLPDEVVTASNGKTIEIVSTDAEGRLLLCDALVYAKKYNPDVVVDIATLTGASYAAFIGQMASVFSNDKTVVANLQQAADNVDERIWEMPLDDVYFEALKSDTADMKNSARASGISSAPMFLKQFVDYPWIHIDIAGLAGESRKLSYSKKGMASGFGVRLLTDFVKNWDK